MSKTVLPPFKPQAPVAKRSLVADQQGAIGDLDTAAPPLAATLNGHEGYHSPEGSTGPASANEGLPGVEGSPRAN